MPEERKGLIPWVVIHLEERLYSLPLERVVEIVRMVALDPVPHAPAWLAGLMNYRGRPIAAIDLRCCLGLARRQPGLETLIVVAEAGGQTVGLIAGEAVDVIELEPTAYEPAAHYGAGFPLVESVGRADDRLILMLDLDRLVGATGIPSLSDERHGAEHAVIEPR